MGGDKLGFNQVVALARNEDVSIDNLKKKKDNASKILSAKAFKIRKCILDDTFSKWVDYGI